MQQSSTSDSSISLVIIGYVWPEPVSSAAGVRTWQIINAIQKLTNWKITFLSPSKENSFSDALKNRGIAIHMVSANDSSFDALIRSLAPNFVIFDRFVLEEQFGWRVKEQCPDAMRIIDTQDLHSLRRAREKAFLEKATVEYFSEDFLRELASMYRSDSSLIISDFEKTLLEEKFQLTSSLLYLLRFFYDDKTERTNLSFEDRKNFLFLGNYRHPPNHDAALWLCQEIWPSIFAKLPSAALHLYGAYAPKNISSLHNPSKGIHFMGHAPDQYESFSQYRVNLAPLRFGAGIKGKISDAWLVHTPCISTSIGAEGMGYKDGQPWGGIMADEVDNFSTAACELYTNEKLWQSCSERGDQLMQDLFSFEKVAPAFIQHLIELKQNFSGRRKNNFIGQMLWHHTMQSTKYMSRWIEEKNKKLNSL